MYRRQHYFFVKHVCSIVVVSGRGTTRHWCDGERLLPWVEIEHAPPSYAIWTFHWTTVVHVDLEMFPGFYDVDHAWIIN